MSKWYMTCAVLAAVAGGLANADEIVVGVNERKSVSVAADETTVQSDAVWVAEGGTLDKVGKGDWTLPMSTLEQPGDVTIVVRDGSVTVPASGSAPTCAVPTETMNKAAFWVDAAVNVDQEGGNVSSWRDVRETKTAAPFDYPRAFSAGTATPTQVAYPGSDSLKRIYFGGTPKSGQWMRFIAPNTAATGAGHVISGIRHFFAVTGIFNVNAYIIDVESGSPIFHPASSACPKNSTIVAVNGENCPPVMNSRFWLNGRMVDPTVATPKQDAHQLYEFQYCALDAARLGSAENFYNDRNFDNRQGGDYLCEALIFTNELTEVERIAVERHLIAKWSLGDAAGARSFAIASGAQVNLTGDTDAYSFSGEGTVQVSGTRANLAFAPAFGGMAKFGVGSSARVTDDVYVYSVEAGDRLSVADDCGGQAVSRARDVAADALVKDGNGTARVSSIPAGVNRLVVAGGTLSLAAPSGAASAVVPGSDVAAAIPNASFEEASSVSGASQGDVTLYGASQTGREIVGWTGTYVSFPGSAVGPANTDTYGDFWSYKIAVPLNVKATFSSYPAPDRDWAFAMRGTGKIETTAQVPCDGVYELSFMLCGVCGTYRTSQQWGGSPLDVYIGADADSLVHLGRSLKDGLYGYRKLVYRTPFLKKGTCVIRFATEDSGTHRSPKTFDDIKLTLVSAPSREVTIPGGGFEDYTTSNWFYDMTKVDDVLRGWTVTPGTGASGVAGAIVAREELLVNTSKPMAAQADMRYGDTELFLVAADTVLRKTFKPGRTGRFRLQARLAKWYRTIGSALSSDPVLSATCAVGEAAAADLGTVTTTRQRLTEVTWAGVIEVTDEEAELTLTLQNTVASAAARVDDLRLVPLESLADESANLIQNGDFEVNSTGWTLVQDRDESVWGHARSQAIRRATTGSAAYGNNACPGYGINGINLIDYAGMYQTVSFPAAGRYRLRFHARGRTHEEYAPGVMPYGSNSSVRAVLVIGNSTNEICRTRTSVTNFVAHTGYFTVPAKGEYVFGIEGTNHPVTEGVDVRDQGTFVDGVSIVAADAEGPARAKLTLPETFELEVAKGAKLDVDFNGRQKVASVRLGGRRRSGVISAETDPDYITGEGELYVEPNGLMLIVR